LVIILNYVPSKFFFLKKAGGLGLGKQGGDIKAKLDLKNIETSVENALSIVQSDKL
jgi:hypothetical protein